MRLQVYFYKTTGDNQPVRDWLKELPREDRKIIGEDLKTVQFGWPLGMPLIRKLDSNLWEVRSRLHGRIDRDFLQLMMAKWFYFMASSKNHNEHQPAI